MTPPAEPGDPDESKPGIVDRFRARYHWFDHVMRAQERYQDSKGDFYAAGITYFTIFALFPMLMVGFAIGGFILASQPELLADIQERIKSTITGDIGQQLIELMDSAIKSRTSVGIIGLVTAAWAGLGWMANLREALSQMWGLARQETKGFIGTKLSDLTAMVGLFLALVVTIGLTVLGSSSVMKNVLEWVGLEDVPGVSVALRVASLAMSVLR
jgi:membrane protein